ncbi:MAG: anti-sigma factor antagonist [Clostridia bacterium]|nr:anti-sigma factor antagonist [Clostridia bacterium]
MNYQNEDKTLTVLLSGRIDSSNADAVEKEISEIREQNAHDIMILDADGLEYISSAGLRVVLRLKKSEPSLCLINVNSEVYEIFEMTGFTEMMDIKKAFRRISLEGAELIGQGANGKVYRVNDDTIVKVYINPDSFGDIQRERDLAKKAFVLGIPTAISYDIARVGDSYGTVFEMLTAKSFAKLIFAEPEKLDYYIGLYVDLLKKIHKTLVKEGDMPDMKEVALSWAKFDMDYLPKEIGEKLFALVNAIPKDNHMLHGDYHVKNVMMQDGETLLIDMDTLCVGNPVFELGSMFNAYEGFSALDPSVSSAFLGISHELAVKIWEKSLSAYLGTTDKVKLEEAENKAKIIGFMRLLRRSIRRGGLSDATMKSEIDFYIEQLVSLVGKTDTLII